MSSLLIVLGFKLLMIYEFNPITPYWDQWRAEGELLYTPIIEGHFNPAVLISPWNEHRILFARIINLAVFYGVGFWYPAVQMVVNSFIHCATIFTVVYLLTRYINIYARSILILFLTLIYVIPFDFENTLVGIAVSFYLIVLFSVLSVYMMSNSRAFSGVWLAGLMLSVASYFNLASGALTAATSAIVMALQLVVGSRQRTAREYVAMAVCVALAIIEVLKIPDMPVPAYRAHSLTEFVVAMINQASYPFGTPYGLLQYIPSIILIARVFARKPGLSAYEWTALAILVWLGSQMMSIAYGRGNLGVMASRYTDMLILGLSTNLSVAFYLLQNYWSKYFSTKLRNDTLLGRWLLALCVVTAIFATWAVPFGRTQFAAARTIGEALKRQTEDTKAFLHTGDVSVLQGKAPFSDPALAPLLSEFPTIRSILHPALTGRPLRQDLLLPVWLSKAIRHALLFLMQSGRTFIGIGIGMWLAIPTGSLWSLHGLREGGSKAG